MNHVAKGFAFVIAVVAAVSFSPLNSSAFVGEDGAPPVGRIFNKMATELGLSSQQQQDVKAVFAKNRPQTEPLMKQLMAERRSLRTLIQADTIDEAAIRAQSAKVAAVEADLAVQRAHVAQQVRAILTPEQVQKFKDLQATQDSRMDEKRIHRPNHLKQDK
jgi:protein CpxP